MKPGSTMALANDLLTAQSARLGGETFVLELVGIPDNAAIQCDDHRNQADADNDPVPGNFAHTGGLAQPAFKRQSDICQL